MKPWPGRLVLLGHPVSHSLSPTFQNAALRSAGIPLRYEALDVAPAALERALEALAADRGAGNVTIPHKEAIALHCDRLSSIAQRVGAVNSFAFEEGALVGDNTDVAGFDAAVRQAVGEVPAGARVALLGAGGAAAAVLAAVERWRDPRVRIWNRTAPRAVALAARFDGVAEVSREIEEAVAGAQVVINATAIGLSGDAHPAPLAALGREAVIIDLVYRRGGTPWVRAARERGMRATDGLPMLIEQGALAFEGWFGVAPNRSAMWAALD
jgi:shikimate dehydrogenase